MITLQINTSGSWKNVLQFDPQRRKEILGGLAALEGVLRESASWCLLHPDGKREWLHGIGEPGYAWSPITPIGPPPLLDVMVSVFGPGDDKPDVYLAYRKHDGKFYISGTFDQVIPNVYAWADVPEAAPVPAAQAESA